MKRKRDTENARADVPSECDLTKRSTVVELVRVYEKAEADIRRGCELITGAGLALDGVFKLTHHRGFEFREAHNRRIDFAKPDDAIAELRRQVWGELVERLELKRMMSIAKAKELGKWLEGPPEQITVETVTGLFKHHIEKLPEMLAEAVGEVYELLRPPRSRYKTNTEFALKKRVILSGWIEGGCWGLRPSYYHHDHYRALDNVFSALDGRGQIGKEWKTELMAAIEGVKEGTGRTRYFGFRACRNGNLHLEFLRPDLVARFNAIAGGRRLEPGAKERDTESEAAA